MAELLWDCGESLECMRFNNSDSETTPLAMRGLHAYTCKAYISRIEGGNHSTHPLICASAGPDVDCPSEPTDSRRYHRGEDCLAPDWTMSC